MILFVAGVPGTGKTSYGEWLEKERNFLHIDMERKCSGRSDLYKLWQLAVRTDDYSPFSTAMREMDRNIVITWGFPPDVIALANGIKSQGITSWWFGGDYAFARSLWLARERHTDDSHFRRQCDEIKKNWNQIEALFAPNILEVLFEDGRRLTFEEIAAKMQLT